MPTPSPMPCKTPSMTEAELAAARWQGTVTRLLGDRENAVYEIATPTGRAALRLHRTGYQTAAAIRSELEWTANLAARGLPVPAPLPTPGGETLILLPSGRHASAVTWVAGDPLGKHGEPLPAPLPLILSRHQALGRLLASLHATDAAPTPFDRPLWDRDGLVGEAPVWGRFWDHPAATETDRTMLIRARDALRECLTGPTQPIHADVLRENVLACGPHLSLIDFDDCGTGYPLYDLGTALCQSLYEPAYPAIRDALMDGYGTTDVPGVERMTLARVCASVGWTMPRLVEGDAIHRRHIARAVMWAERVV